MNDFFAQSSCATYAVCKANQAAVIDPDFDLEIAGPLACGIQTGCGIVMNTLKMQENPSPQSFAVYGCGSEAMMRELARKDAADGQFAFDARMGCGFGACMGCAIRTPHGMKRVCKDGPVFRKEDLL